MQTIASFFKILKKKNFIKKQQKVVLEKYQLMGEKVYRLYLEGADVGTHFEESCADIKNRIIQIQEYHQAIQELKSNQKICSQCGTQQTEKKAEFCANCGTKLD